MEVKHFEFQRLLSTCIFTKDQAKRVTAEMGISDLKAKSYEIFLKDCNKVILEENLDYKVRQLAAILFRNIALDREYGTEWSDIPTTEQSEHLKGFMEIINSDHKEFQLSL